MRQGIAVAGSILVDNIYEISAYPSAGELTQIRSLKKSVGGCVPNVAVDLKKISPDTPIYAIGKVGDDENGAYVKETFGGAGVDASGVLTSASEPTSFTDVMSVVGGQRTFFTYAGASATFGFDEMALENFPAKMLHLGYFLLLDKVDGGDGERILKAAKERGVVTSIDLVSENSDRYAIVKPCLPYTDNLIINEVEAGKITGIAPEKENLKRIAETLAQMGVCERVIIHTPEVGVCLHQGVWTVVPSYELPKEYIQGTTGAGDAFCAGCLVGIYEGATDEEILALGSKAAVASLGAADATSGLVEKPQLENVVKGLKRKEICL